MEPKSSVDWICEISKTQSLGELADCAFGLLKNPVFITDAAHTILAYTKCVKVDQPLWRDNVINGDIASRTMRESRDVELNHKASMERNTAIKVDADDKFPFSRIIKVIVSDGKMVGIMVVSGFFTVFEETDVKLADIVASFAKPLIQRTYCHAAKSTKTAANYIIGLLDGKVATTESVRQKLSVLHVEAMPYWYVLVIASDNISGEDVNINELILRLSRVLHCCAFLYNDQIVCVLGVKREIKNWEEDVSSLNDIVMNHNLAVGVSRCFRDLADVRQHYIQSVSALDISRAFSRKKSYRFYDYSLTYKMFRMLGDDLVSFCHQKVRELNDYDRQHHTELCATLQIYLENYRSLSRTADILFIHKNSVRYRIEKCKDLLASNFDGNEESFSFILSLRIIEYNKITYNK
jgi:sugar diacid utilization regulator